GPGRRLRPVAERLIYRRPAERLDVAVQPDRRRYVPGQKASLQLGITDEKGRPAPALAMVRVVDHSVVTLADDKTERTMPTHFLLASEVRQADDLEYADFLLGPHPKGAQALDLLLGTQGWRRFTERGPEEFRPPAEHEDTDLLVMAGQSATGLRDDDRGRIEKEKLAFATTFGRLQQRYAEAGAALARAV